MKTNTHDEATKQKKGYRSQETWNVVGGDRVTA
jgi:hypothetical protein